MNIVLGHLFMYSLWIKENLFVNFLKFRNPLLGGFLVPKKRKHLGKGGEGGKRTSGQPIVI